MRMATVKYMYAQKCLFYLTMIPKCSYSTGLTEPYKRHVGHALAFQICGNFHLLCKLQQLKKVIRGITTGFRYKLKSQRLFT